MDFCDIMIYLIDRLQLTSSPPCWMTIDKRIILISIVPVIQHGRQGLCHLNLTGMVTNHLLDVLLRSIAKYFGERVGRVKIQTTSKNSQRYYTTKRLIRELLSNTPKFYIRVGEFGGYLFTRNA